MDNYDFFNTFVTAVAGNSTIAAWCQSNFGKAFSVFADVTSAGVPVAEDMPYAIFHTPGVQKHQERREQTYSIAVDIALDKSTLTTRAEGNVDQPAGVELILDIAQLIVTVVKAALPVNTVFGYTLAADTLGALPEIFAYIDLDFTTHITIAGDPLA